jgi:hypothetical protein
MVVTLRGATMTKPTFIEQFEAYEEQEAARRRSFIERMEQKLQFKMQANQEKQHETSST